MKNHDYKKLLLSLVLLTTSTYGQNTWEKKDYTEWTKKEALQILSASPWSQTKGMELPTDKPFDPYFVPLATVRLRSALPIRRALVRLKQLKVKYDRLSPKDKAKVDDEVTALLECSICTKFYVISFELRFGFDLKKFDKLSEDEHKFIYLITDKGERRNLATFVREDREIFLFFNRLENQEKPLLTSDTSEVHLVIDAKALKNKLPLLMPPRFTFEIASLTQGNEILF